MMSQQVSIDSFTHSQREKTLEILLSQERVIALLYKKTFPAKVGIFKAATPADSVAMPDVTKEELDDIYKHREVPATEEKA